MHKLRAILCVLLVFIEAKSFAETSATNSPWSHVVMVGASASAGFVITEPFGGTNTLKCRVNYYLDSAITAPHEPVENLANAMFFLQPEAAGRTQIDQAAKLHPTVLVGVDFLFWFCYGPATNDAQRAERFENGLKLLEPIHCPIVLGDIPDASFATNTGIITEAQVPSAVAMSAANARLREWAATRSQVAVVPLSNFMHAAMANQALMVHGDILPAGQTRAILQADALHPNSRGATWLALGILDALVSKRPEFFVTDVRWNPSDILRIGAESALARTKISTNSPNPATSK